MKTATEILLIVAVCISTTGVDGAQTPGAYQSKRSAQIPEVPFSIVISPRAETTTNIGKPLIIMVTVANVTDHDVIFPAVPLEDPRNHFHIEVHDGQGNKIPFRKPYGRVGNPPKMEELPMGSERGDFMRPRTSETFDLDLQKTFALNEPGKYVVQAKLFLEADKTWIKSNAITISVAP